MDMKAADRAALAEKVGVNEQYLYQCLTGRKAMKPEEAVRVERESAGQVTRRDLRPEDWHRIWPELVTDEHPAPDPQPAAVQG